MSDPTQATYAEYLGALLGVDGRQVRQYFRDHHPRSIEQKGRPWTITVPMIVGATRYFTCRAIEQPTLRRG